MSNNKQSSIDWLVEKMLTQRLVHDKVFRVYQTSQSNA
jgi:hypothetical protein